MREGIGIKANWLLFRRGIIAKLPMLGIDDPEEVYRKAKELYRQEMSRLPEYGDGDVLKLNLSHAVMLASIYKVCGTKPDLDTLTSFYREIILYPGIIRWALKKKDFTDREGVRRQQKIAKKSEKASHPFTWQLSVDVKDEARFTANFTRCGIYDYLKSVGLGHLTPAMCAMDYTFAEFSNHLFLRKSTLATGGSVCDCGYVRRTEATAEEKRESEYDRVQEARRGGRTDH